VLAARPAHAFAAAELVPRGEIRADVDPNLLLESLVGPLYLRLLITREPLDDAFVEALVTQLIHP